MIQKAFTIKNEVGLHARPAAMLVQKALEFKSDIYLEGDGKRVNGKSILGVLMLAAPKGQQITVVADGEDEQDAVEAIGKVFECKFGED